ncbi:hypothetical protein [Lentzea sp.]|uniref:hypothetical protein n=1 Tax=Lentzea sp. TaxID=56099 RepID=UPI002B8DF2F4|nr:hypothetical protein [Lentzea sp.]HUQ58414.1 hypothetical protein [Lentzea sp.]
MNEAPRGRSSDVYARFGLERRGEVHTVHQLHDQVIASNTAAYGPIVGPLLTMLRGNDQLDDMLEGQSVALLGQGVPSRQAPAAPAVHYLGIPHQQLYDMVNNGVDAGAVGQAGFTYTQIGNRLTAFQDRIAAAIGDSETEWKGTAATKAHRAMAQLGNRAAEAGTAAQLAGTLITQQSRALSTVQHAVPPAPAQPYDPAAANARRMTITNPIQYAVQMSADMSAYQEQQEKHADAARAVETYDRTVTQTATAQPGFAPGPPAPPPPPRPEPHPLPQPLPQPTPRPRPPAGIGDSTGRRSTPVATPGDTTSAAWTAPPVSGTNTTSASGLNGVVASGGQSGDSTHHRGGNPGFFAGPVPDSRGAGRTSGPGGTGRGGSGPGGSRAPSGGAGYANPNAGRGFGPGGSAGVLSGEGTASRSATGTGATANSRSGPGAMGAMGAGPAKGKGDEDLERTTPSYLQEPDTDGIFGSDARVVPPVIGG